MTQLHRVQWIDTQIRAGRFPNTRAVSNHFEISRRQALRDFEYLRDSLGAPLAYSAARRGFCYTCDAYVLPGPYVTPVQRDLLTRLASYYDAVARSSGAGLYAEMAVLLGRLGGPTGGQPPDSAPAIPDTARQPYRARLQPLAPPPEGSPVPPTLAPFWRGAAGPGEYLFEFEQPQEFLAALLAGGLPYRIVWPRWLREQLRRHLSQWHDANRAEELR